MTLPSKAPADEGDFVAWLEAQPRHARRGEIGALDLENIPREREGMARIDRREIRNRHTILLVHLLKYWMRPERRSANRPGTIAEQRDRIPVLVEDSPSLRCYPAQMLDRSCPAARRKASIQMRARESAFPQACPFNIADVLNVGSLPRDRAK